MGRRGRADDVRLVLAETFNRESSPWKVPAERYDMIVGGSKVGHVSLRLEDAPHILKYVGHIGYGVIEEHRGHGYATEGCRLILPIARTKGLTTVWISCHPDNIASIRTLERLGAEYVDTVDLPKDERYYPRGERQKRRYRIKP